MRSWARTNRLMVLGNLVFSSANWLWLTVILLSLALILLGWSYWRAGSAPLRWTCLLLKLLGFAALAVCLLEPLWSGQRARPGANIFAVVADNSAGMQIKDRGEVGSRGEGLRELLNPRKTVWQTSLEDNFDLRRYFFDARIQSTKDWSELVFDGRATAIGSALRTLVERYRNRPLAGILLLTDGNATDIHGSPDLTGLPPVYPVVLGRPDTIKDVAVQQVSATQTAFEDAPVSIQADVSAAGYSGENIVGQVLDQSGKLVAEQVLRSRKDNEHLAFRFQLRPEKPGVSFYRFRAGIRNELPNTAETTVNAAPPVTSEATLANNSHVLAIDRGRGPYRILYVSGRPNWEFKFLNRAVQEDKQIDMVALIRVAKREPKFNFMGRIGESSNPLFRGFANQEGVEQYDQPVLVRLNTRDQVELRAGFPRTPEDLYQYSAVVIDDLESEFFTPDQAALLQRFVSERGGGLLMLGGMECFQQGNYQKTPIGDLLPVYLDKVEQTNAPAGLRLNLTREGWLQAWARLRDNEPAEKARISTMAPFQVLNRVRDVKPGASIVATVTDEGGKAWPAIVVQRFGRGRTGAVTLGDVWHWGLHDEEAHKDMDKQWRQMMRWLVTDVPNRVDLAVEPKADDPNGAVELQVRVRDPKFQPLDNASVTLEIQPVMTEGAAGPTTNTLRLQAEPALNEPGVYTLAYVPRYTGGYHASVVATNAEGAEVGRAEGGWSTDLAAEEFKSLTPNVGLLETIAKQTGGQILSAGDLDAFAKKLPNKKAPVMEAWTFPLWHTPAMFAFALACFLSEWGLRRWKGLA
jgi:uncharacterized membrane protein